MPKSSKQKLAYQAEYNARPENVKKRVLNNAARQAAIKRGDAKVGDGKDVAHKVALDNGGRNTKGNTVVQDQKTNRGWRKGQSGYKVPNKK
jgi:hypothetical protein